MTKAEPVTQYESLEQMVSQIEGLESKINFLVNDFMMKQI